jgi:hypothetical protein
MQDVLYIGIALAFFAICVAYVRGLDRLVRASEEGETAQTSQFDEIEQEAA